MSVTESILNGMTRVFNKLFGSANDRQLKRLWPMVEEVKSHYPAAQALADEDFPKKTDEFRRRVCKGESVDRILYEAFAVCREAAHRTLGGKKVVYDKWIDKEIRFFGHFDVQILGGIVLHEGKIAEMVTGEGKTLVATLPAYLNGLVPDDAWVEMSRELQGPDPERWTFRPYVRDSLESEWRLADDAPAAIAEATSTGLILPVGRGVHVITVNDYLARRDAADNRPLFEFLGLTVGAIQSDMDSADRVPQYVSDITYGTNNEFGFDYLRDNLKVDFHSQVQRSRAFAIVDEVDSVLIDEARTPLIISGSADISTDKYPVANRVAKQLKGRHQNDVDDAIAEFMRQGHMREDARLRAEEGVDYIYSERDHSAKLTEQGQNRVAQKLGIQDLYSGANLEWQHLITNALTAQSLYKRDHHYVVKDGQVIIVDEFTGRLMEGRRWSDGLHQAVEAKEGLRIKEESQTVATITFQNFFRLYGKLAGMTGTAVTEAREFLTIYSLEVVSIPTNRPLLRKNWPDLIYGTEKEKYAAIVEHVAEVHAMGRPILIGTVSIERSELLSKLLERRGIPHEVLNAKHHAREADIVAEAGYFARVTIATNMAGRGTDIKLGTIDLPQLLEHWKRWKLCPKDLSPEASADEAANACISLWGERWVDAEEEFETKTPGEQKAILAAKWAEYGLHPLGVVERVADLGGLHVVGTERHEARRIDNQLRGRCARQGDPGSSRFFLCLEDDLMRIFAPDRVKNLLQRLGLSDGMPLEHGMVSRSIERAQRKVEERNFEIRKNLLEYDAVMNEQRLIIYERRQAWLEGRDLKETVEEFFRETLELRVAEFADPEASREDWDLGALSNWLRETFLVEMAPREMELAAEGGESLAERLAERVIKAYGDREREIGSESQRMLEKYMLLQTLDRKWMDHLYAMDLLKEGIHLRGYAGQDPKLMYKREGYEMFEELFDSLREEIAGMIMKIRPVDEEEEALQLSEAANIDDTIHQEFGQYENAAESAGANAGEVHHEPFVRVEEKVGPNEPCPCGSGKKFKKCCGR